MKNIMGRMSNMDDNTKIIHEFYYVVGLKDFSNHLILKVDKETEKMMYGEMFYHEGVRYGRFALNKRKLNAVDSVVDSKYGTVYRVYVDENSEDAAYAKAKEIVYNHLIRVAESFKTYERED
jgi:hypothetical protein